MKNGFIRLGFRMIRLFGMTFRSKSRIIGNLSPSIKIGGILVVSICFIALFADLLAPHGYTEMFPGAQLQPPSPQFPFGTDHFGRDILSRVIVGSRTALAYGLGSTLISIVLGVPLGVYAGFVGGRIDEFIMRLMDFILSIPPLMLALLILSVVTPSASLAILSIGIISVPSLVRISKSSVISLKQEEYVDAARASGESTLHILAFEILPNFWPVIIVEGSLRVTFGMLLGASLSFLGLGAQPPSPDWGLLLNDARPFIERAPWIVIFPGIVMALTVIGTNLLGAGLRDTLDPRLQH